MLEQNFNTIQNNIKNKRTNGEEEKNFKKKLGFLSSTHQEFNGSRKNLTELSYLKNFQGFFNKNFNLTSFREKKQNFRIKSLSPEKKIIQHQMKGNGIPNDIIERIKFLGNIFKSNRFKKFFKSISKLKNIKFEEICDKIHSFSLKYSQLEGIMLSYYYICHTIKYDYKHFDRNMDYKKSQSIEAVIKYKRALALGFTNLFEALMKKLEVKYKHIEGYCKIMPERVKYISYNTDNNSSFNDSNIKNKSKEKENMYNKNTSIAFTKYNDSSIINNSKFFRVFKTLTKMNLNDDEEEDISDYINHCWNAFYYKGEWYLVDVTLGSCWFDKNKLKNNLINTEEGNDNHNQDNYKEDEVNFEYFNPYYFMAPPQYMIYSHLPGKTFWQLNEKFCTLKQFQIKRNIDFAQFYLGLYKYNLEFLTNPNPIIVHNIKEKLFIRLKIVSYIIEGNIYDITCTHKLGEVKYSLNRKQFITRLEPIFPKVGEYYIKLNIRAISSNDIVYKPLFDYYVRVTNDLSFNYFEKYIRMKQAKTERDKLENNLLLPKIKGFSDNKNVLTQGKIITDYNKVFPSKNNKIICYDNEGFALLEPRTVFIRKGIITKFKVLIKGAQSAFILDGNKWIQLKKIEENIFSGQKEIKTDNVSICCIKNKNVFTEVFRFKNRKKLFFEKTFATNNRKQARSLNK